MAEAYRGLTIRFKADGTKVLTTLRAMNRAASDVESELRMVKRALRLDGSDAKAAQRQMELLREKAAAVGGRVERIKSEMRELGRVDFGNEKMRELSARIKDASTKASLMNARYNNSVESLARLHNRMTELWADSKRLSAMPNPFDRWKEMPTEGIQRAIGIMERFGAISKEEAEKAKSSVAMLRAEYKETEAQLKTLNSVAAYQSWGDKAVKEAAQAKAAYREVAAAAKQVRETGFEGRLKESRAEGERLEAQARKLKAALRLDPKSIDAASAHTATLRAQVRALEAESTDLRAEMAALGRETGIRELASDTVRLGAEMRAASKDVDRLAKREAEVKAQANAAAERILELRRRLNEAGDTEAGRKIAEQLKAAESRADDLRRDANLLSESFERAAERAQMLNRAMRFSEGNAALASNRAAIAGINEQMNQQKKFTALSSSALTSLGMTMYSTLYPAVMMGGMYAVQAADDVDSAYRDMRKTVQGTEEDFQRLRDAAIAFGDTHYTSADTVLEIEALGGQLGITVDNLEQFGKVVSDLEIATDENFNAEEISLWLGKMANIMHLNVEEYDNFADSLVRLGNSEPALESDIANITSRFAGMASIVGMAPDEILAVATAATATGQKAEAAGGSLMRTLGRIESATAGVSEGMRNLEDATDEDLEAFEAAKDGLQDYADLAGMTSEQFAKAWEADPTATFQKIIDGLKRVKDEGGSVEYVLKDVLGIGSIRDRQLLSGLTQTTDVLAESLSMSKNAFNGIADEFGDAGDAAREAANKSQGFSGTLQILKNNGQHLGSVMAESLVPILKDVTGVVQGAVSAFDKLDPAMQTAITGGILSTAGLGPIMTFLGAASNAITSAKASWKEYTSAEQTATRMQRSTIAQATGLTARYEAQAASLQENRAALEARRASLEKVMERERAHKASLGSESAALAAQRKELESSIAAQEAAIGKQEKSIGRKANAAAGIGILKGVGKTLAVMGAIDLAVMGLTTLVSYFSEAAERAETLQKATGGLDEASRSMKRSFEITALGSRELADGLGRATGTVGDYRKEAEEAAQAGASFADSINSKMGSAEADAVLLQNYANVIFELAGNCDGSAEKLTALKDAVSHYNEMTGESLAVVDDLTGRLNQQNDVIQANTDLFKLNAFVKAYGEVASEAAKNVAELTVKIGSQEDELKKHQSALEGMVSSGEAAYDDHGNLIGAAGLEQAAIDELGGSIADLKSQRESEQATLDRALDLEASAAEAADQESQKLKDLRVSVESYRAELDRLGTGGGSLDEALASAQASTAGFDGTLEDFVSRLSEAGIGAEQFASVGAEQFAAFYEQAGGDLAKVNSLINAVNDYGIDPKHLVVTDDDTVKANMKKLDDLDREKLREKGFEVTDGGTIRKKKDELEDLDKYEARPSVSLDASELDSAIASARRKIAGLNDSKASAVVDVTERVFRRKMASGGITGGPMSIPRHADGGIAGIATRATLTNYGWVGEAGDEAIVPLTNKRYVRPFAKTVADMIDVGQQQTTIMNVYLDGKYLAGGVDESTTLGDLARGLRKKARQ